MTNLVVDKLNFEPCIYASLEKILQAPLFTLGTLSCLAFNLI